jgi:excisionase family DNA binding protein
VTIEEMIRTLVREEIESALAVREKEAARKRWMTVTETAQYLGISEVAVRRRIGRGRIPTRRQGRSLVVDRLRLDEEIERAY